jgi:hypothetical protein
MSCGEDAIFGRFRAIGFTAKVKTAIAFPATLPVTSR